MVDFKTVVEDLTQTYDEIKLKVHLGSKDAQDEWATLQARWRAFEHEADLQKSAAEVGDAVKILGAELKDAFGRFRKSL